MIEKTLTRETIIKTLMNSLEPIEYVHAFWEGGAAAFDRIDQFSDIDLYLVVDDNRIKDAFNEVEKSLKSMSPIKNKYEMQLAVWPGVFQAFYKMENASKYLLIDLVVIKMSSQEKFLEPEIHGNVVFYFNKFNKIKIPHVNMKNFSEKLFQRLGRLQMRFDMFNIFVQKEIDRGNSLEAIDLYFDVTVSSLVEILRIKYFPLHHEFKMRYVNNELPADIVKKLEYLCFVRTMKDLQEKYGEATQWFIEETLHLTNYRYHCFWPKMGYEDAGKRRISKYDFKDSAS